MDPRGIPSRVLAVSAPIEPRFRLNVTSTKAFFVLELIGAVGFLLILCTALLSPRLSRYTTWFSFCVSWIISCLSYCLLLFAGQGFDSTPEYGLCATQAALIYAAPVLTALTTCALYMETLANFEAVTNKISTVGLSQLKRVALITVPYVVWLAYFVVVLVISLQTTDRVIRPCNFCETTSGIPMKLTSLTVFLTLIGTIMIQVHIGRRLLILRRSDPIGIKPYLALGIRMILFCLVATLAVIVAFIFVVTGSRGVAYDFVLAFVPIAGICIFGTQRDLVRTWVFWRRENSSESQNFKSTG